MPQPPPSTRKYKLDSQNNLIINDTHKLDGTWTLTENHDLALKLKPSKHSKTGDTIDLTGTIKDVDKNALQFQVIQKSKDGTPNAQTIALKGVWQADEHNRLIFKVKRAKSRSDILTFNNAWVINKHHRVVYIYEKAELITKTRKTHELIFKGHWNLENKTKIYYEMDMKTGSYFDFKIGHAAFEKRRIKYKLTAGSDSRLQTLSLEGIWRLTPTLGLTFDIEYEANKVQPIVFGTDIELTDDTTLSIKLRNGGEFKLSQSILDDTGQAYIKASRGSKPKDNKIEFGVGIRV